jgi:aryl-alcohol dehydrogenase-like predicted oxidoreductase
MMAMAELFEMKQVKAIGVSNFPAKKMRNAWNTLKKKNIPLVSNQVRYNLLDRRIESNGVLDAAKELGISIIAYSPLAQGLITGKFHDNPDLLKSIGLRKYTSQFKSGQLEKSRPVIMMVKELALKYGVSPSQIGLNWVINYHGETVLAIPGATKERHVKENLGALDFRLSDEDMLRLDNVSSTFK